MTKVSTRSLGELASLAKGITFEFADIPAEKWRSHRISGSLYEYLEIIARRKSWGISMLANVVVFIAAEGRTHRQVEFYKSVVVYAEEIHARNKHRVFPRIPCPPIGKIRIVPGEITCDVRDVTTFYRMVAEAYGLLTQRSQKSVGPHLLEAAGTEGGLLYHNRDAPQETEPFLYRLLDGMMSVKEIKAFVSIARMSNMMTIANLEARQFEWIAGTSPKILGHCVMFYFLACRYRLRKNTKTLRSMRPRFAELIIVKSVLLDVWQSGRLRGDINSIEERLSPGWRRHTYKNYCIMQRQYFRENDIPPVLEKWLLPGDAAWMSTDTMLAKSQLPGLQSFAKDIDPDVLKAADTFYAVTSKNGVSDVLTTPMKLYMHKHLLGGMWGNNIALMAMVAIQHGAMSFLYDLKRIKFVLDGIARAEKFDSIKEFDPNEHIRRFMHGKLLPGTSNALRLHFWRVYQRWTLELERWVEILPDKTVKNLVPFLMRPVTDLYVVRSVDQKAMKAETKMTRKDRTEQLANEFPKLTAIILSRFNQIERLHRHLQSVGERHRSGELSFPYDLSYEDREGIFRFVVWDIMSLSKSPFAMRMNVHHRNGMLYSENGTEIILQFVSFCNRDGKPLSEPWYFELIRNECAKWANRDSWGFDHRDFMKEHGYKKTSFAPHDSGLLRQPKFEFFSRSSPEDPLFFSFEPIWMAAVFGRMMLFLSARNGCRMSESLQLPFDERMLKFYDNFGGQPGRTQVVAYWYVKGYKQEKVAKENFITPDVDRMMTETARWVQQWYQRHPQDDPEPNRAADHFLPEVRLGVGNRHREHAGARRFIFQLFGKGITGHSMNCCLRFIMHGLRFRTASGLPISVASHDLRHAFAKDLHMRGQIPLDYLARLLHQERVEMAGYYAAPTDLMQADILLGNWRRHIDYNAIAPPKGTSPAHFAVLKREAEAKVGALAGVLGGSCSFTGYCQNKMRCLGCSHHVPDPARRPEIEREVARTCREIEYHDARGNRIQVQQFQDDLRRAQGTLEIMSTMEMVEQDRIAPQGIVGVNASLGVIES